MAAAARPTEIVGLNTIWILAGRSEACSGRTLPNRLRRLGEERYQRGPVDAKPIETDYLVIGGGATAMAFVDTLLSESDAEIVMVDRNHRPGGHWNHAYSFVGLHQPSAFYGVNSRELSNWTKDETGLNQGMFELSSGPEVLNYFDQVMRQRFLPSGRVQWFR